MAVFVIFMRWGLQFSESLSQTGFCLPARFTYMMGMNGPSFNNGASIMDLLRMTDKFNETDINDNVAPRKLDDLPAAAQRALKEAEARRASENVEKLPREIGGRGGKDPARFGDWEIKGRTIDF